MVIQYNTTLLPSDKCKRNIVWYRAHKHTLTPVTHTHTLTPVTKQKKTVLLITVICKSETELTASVLEKEDPKHKRLKERFSVSTFCSVLFN